MLDLVHGEKVASKYTMKVVTYRVKHSICYGRMMKLASTNTQIDNIVNQTSLSTNTEYPCYLLSVADGSINILLDCPLECDLSNGALVFAPYSECTNIHGKQNN